MSEVKEISREFEFSAAHVLLGHDKCGRLHGHNYKGIVTIEGPVASNGMIYDFNLISQIVGSFDHFVILPNKPEALRVEDEFDPGPSVAWGRYRFPATDVIVIPFPETTAEYIAQCLCSNFVKLGIESGYMVLKITVELWENDRSSAVVEAVEGGK